MTEPDLHFEPTMVREDKTARQLYEAIKANPARARFGYGERAVVVNIDFQQAYTRPDLFPKTSYVTDPRQIDYVNRLSAAARRVGMPVVWTRVAYKDDAGDAGVWGTRTNTPDSLQNIRYDSPRHAYDTRCEIDQSCDLLYTKRMPSAFFESPLASYLVWHRVDTVIVTAARHRAACGRPPSTACRVVTGPSFRKNAWPTSTRATTTPT